MHDACELHQNMNIPHTAAQHCQYVNLLVIVNGLLVIVYE